MDETSEFFGGYFPEEFLLDEVNYAESQFNQMHKRLVGVNSFFALEQFQRHLIVIVGSLVFVVVLPQVLADLFVHEVELFNLMTAGAQQVGSDVAKPLVVLDVGHIPALNFSLRLHLLVKNTLVFLYRLFDSKPRRSQRLEYRLTVSVQ